MRNPRFYPGGDAWLRKRDQLARQLRKENPALPEAEALSRATKIIRVLWNLDDENKKKAPGIVRVRNKLNRKRG